MKSSRAPKRTNDRLIKSVARRLKELRAERGVSQEYVNENTNLNISRIEAGSSGISLVTLELLCRFYGITVKAFFNSLEDDFQ